MTFVRGGRAAPLMTLLPTMTLLLMTLPVLGGCGGGASRPAAERGPVVSGDPAGAEAEGAVGSSSGPPTTSYLVWPTADVTRLVEMQNGRVLRRRDAAGLFFIGAPGLLRLSRGDLPLTCFREIDAEDVQVQTTTPVWDLIVVATGEPWNRELLRGEPGDYCYDQEVYLGAVSGSVLFAHGCTYYEGGAHGSYSCKSLPIDLTTGKLVEVFPEQAQRQLTATVAQEGNAPWRETIECEREGRCGDFSELELATVRPVYAADGRASFRFLVTRGTCHACASGGWGFYAAAMERALPSSVDPPRPELGLAMRVDAALVAEMAPARAIGGNNPEGQLAPPHGAQRVPDDRVAEVSRLFDSAASGG